MKKLGEQEAWAYPETAQFFRVPPIISGTGKATDFKFCIHIYGSVTSARPTTARATTARGQLRVLLGRQLLAVNSAVNSAVIVSATY